MKSRARTRRAPREIISWNYYPSGGLGLLLLIVLLITFRR
jgi:hypothetical protein